MNDDPTQLASPASREGAGSEGEHQAPKKSLWAWLRRTLVALAVIYLWIVVLMMILERAFIFFPSTYPEGDWKPSGFPHEDAHFQAADGARLHGWYVPHDSPRAVILFCHGNGGNITHRSDILQMLYHRVGATVLIFDYRGYGRSEGKPDEPGVLADARAARDWLAQRAKIAPNKIVLMGESLGGAVAVHLAAQDGAGALVLQSTFPSIPDVAAYHYPWLPVRWLMRTRLDAQSKISNYHSPLLQSHGDADTIVPYSLGQRLFAAANEPKQFYSIPNRDHNDPAPPAYYDALAAFLDKRSGQ